MSESMKNRLRHPAFWAAILSGISQIGAGTGLFTVPAEATLIFNTVTTVLIALGIFIDPTTSGIKDAE